MWRVSWAGFLMTRELWSGGLDFSVEWAVVLAGAEICAFQVSGAECIPSAGAEDAGIWDVVHVNGNAEHGGERDVKIADVAVGHDAMVCAPVVHDFVGAGECALASEDRGKPSGRPRWVGALVERVVDVIREIHCVTFRDLECGAEAADEVQADHRGGHAAASAEASAETATGKIFGDRRVPGGGFEAFFHLGVGDFPERLHGGLAVDFLFARAVERGRPGVDEVEDAVGDLWVLKGLASGFGDGVEAPVGAEVGEDLCTVCEEVPHEHAGAVECVVLGGDDVGRAFAVPVEGRIEDRFEEVAVGEVVGPLALALESCGDGVVSVRLLAESHFGEFGISDH